MAFIFTFSFNPETQEAAFAGNIPIQQALQILQNIAVADAVRQAREAEKTGQKDKKSDIIKKKEKDGK